MRKFTTLAEGFDLLLGSASAEPQTFDVSIYATSHGAEFVGGFGKQGEANPGVGAYEIRPLSLFLPGP